MHPVELDKIADFMGELVGSAKLDWDTADPSEIGLHGVPIKQWRAAYYEGCKDMADGIFSRLPTECSETIKNIVLAAFNRAKSANDPHS